MLGFLRRYGLLFFAVIPVWMVLGNLRAPLELIVLIPYLIYVLNTNRSHEALLLFIIALVLSDSRAHIFHFIKFDRYPIVIILFLYTLKDLLTKKYRFNTSFNWAIPMIIISMIALIYSPTFMTGLLKTISYFMVIFVALHFIQNRVKIWKGIFLMDLTYLFIVIQSIGWILYFINPTFVTRFGRYQGLMGNPNGLGLFSIFTYILLIVGLNKFPKFKKEIFIGILLTGISTLMCGSRNAIGSVILFSIFSIFYFGKTRKVKTFLLWFFIVPGFFYVYFTVDFMSILQNMGLADELRVDSIATGNGRFLAWEVAFDKIKDNPFMGKGFGYNEYYFRSLRDYFIQTEHQGLIHNSFISIVFNLGYLGLFAFLLLLFGLLKLVKDDRFLIPFVGVILLSANFEDWMISALNICFIFFLLVLLYLQDFQSPKARQFSNTIGRLNK